jgi:hypothetical protein
MSTALLQPEALDRLLAALVDGELSEQQFQALQHLLSQDPAAEAYYRQYMRLCALLEFDRAAETGDVAEISDNGAPTESLPFTLPAISLAPPSASGLPSPIVVPTGFHHAGGNFASGWPVAYLVATIIFGIGLVVGAVVHVSTPSQMAQLVTSGRAPNPQFPIPNPSAVVARITGMVECEWEGAGDRVQGSGTANQKSEIRNQKSLLCLGDRIALQSGLLEITYDTGAKVILQGPVRYEVESLASGYLSVGKLSAKLEQKEEDRGEKGERGVDRGSDSRPQNALTLTLSQRERGPQANQKSEIIHQTFAVRTPTVLVTDLGTEFGVEVDAKGQSSAHVFRGSIRVQAMSRDGTPQGDARVLSANQSARVERDGKTSGGNPVICVEPSGNPPAFVRKMPKQTIKALDLVDVVAGGDGFSNRRNRGINATIGQPVDALWPEQKPGTYLRSDGQYHRIAGMPLVDGVFIPDGSKESVQVDSTGRRSDGFRGGADAAGQYIWAGGTMPPYPTTIGGVDYATANHGVLLLHANNAITFDLEAMRRATPGCRVLQFRAVVGNVETASQNGDDVLADVWVLVDGRKRFTRRAINRWNGAMPIALPLGGQDRFLTLAATDGGNGVSCDWIVFGDPRLELSLPETNERNSEKAM